MSRAGKLGSPEITRAYERASADLGEQVVASRKAAKADLGMSVAP